MGKRGSNRGDSQAKKDFKLVHVLERYVGYRADQATDEWLVVSIGLLRHRPSTSRIALQEFFLEAGYKAF